MESIQAAVMQEMFRYFDSEKVKKLENYRQLNPYVKKGGILFTGSSLMEQFPICEYCIDSGITLPVYNRGIGGYTTDDFLKAIDIQLFDLEPSKIFINIGTNDFNKRKDGSDWEEHLLKNYEEILQQIKERLPKAKVILMAYYPVNEHLPEAKKTAATDRMLAVRTNENLKRVNMKICQLAERFGYQYVDANDGLTDEKGDLKEEYTIEGIHMYTGTYKIVFENLRKYI